MKLDFFTKTILSLIAIALWVLVIQAFFETKPVTASSGLVDVNIAKIDGRNIDSVLDVNIKEVSGRTLYDENLPVEIKQ